MTGIDIETALWPDEIVLVWFPDKSMQIVSKDAIGNIETIGLSGKQVGILKELLLRADNVKT